MLQLHAECIKVVRFENWKSGSKISFSAIGDIFKKYYSIKSVKFREGKCYIYVIKGSQNSFALRFETIDKIDGHT